MSQRVADIRIDPAMIESFGRTMRQKLTSGSVPFRKAYLRSLVDVIEVDDAQIRIKGCKDLLERAILASRAGMSLRWRGDYLVCSSRVRASASDLIAGAASRTTGNIVTQAINQDASQFQKKLSVASVGKLAMPVAIRQVNPDWMTAKTKWV